MDDSFELGLSMFKSKVVDVSHTLEECKTINVNDHGFEYFRVTVSLIGKCIQKEYFSPKDLDIEYKQIHDKE